MKFHVVMILLVLALVAVSTPVANAQSWSDPQVHSFICKDNTATVVLKKDPRGSLMRSRDVFSVQFNEGGRRISVFPVFPNSTTKIAVHRKNSTRPHLYNGYRFRYSRSYLNCGGGGIKVKVRRSSSGHYTSWSSWRHQ